MVFKNSNFKSQKQLARRMRKVFDEVGLVLLRGNREMGNNLEAMKLWAEFIFPSLSQYEAGANARKGKVINFVCSSSNFSLFGTAHFGMVRYLPKLTSEQASFPMFTKLAPQKRPGCTFITKWLTSMNL